MIRYNYLMLKPESQKNFLEIYDEIQRRKLGSIKLYGVTDWTNLSKKIYENQLKKNSEFETSFESLAYIINYLFGNEAIIVLIKNIYNNENFEKDILQFKKQIREKYSKSDRLYLLIDLAKIKEINADKTKTSEIFLKDSYGNLRKISRISEEGIFKFHTLSYIHSPDDNEEIILRELNILQKLKILSKKNEISEGELDMIKKYKTYKIIADREIQTEREL